MIIPGAAGRRGRHAASGMSTSGVLVHWDVTSPYLDGLSFALQGYAGSDAATCCARMIP